MALLGHNLKDVGGTISIKRSSSGAASQLFTCPFGVNLDNLDGNDVETFKNGFTIYDFPDDSGWVGSGGQWNIEIGIIPDDVEYDLFLNAVSWGTKYEMPHSPDMQLSMSREFGGVIRQESKGGAMFNNATYTKQPPWIGEPWGLYDTDEMPNLNLRRMGRRVWNLKFSHIADSDLMPQTEMLNFEGIVDSANYTPFIESNSLFLFTNKSGLLFVDFQLSKLGVRIM